MGRVSRSRVWLAAAVLGALCLCAGAHARQARTDVAGAPLSQGPYRVGERLTYTVSFSNFPTAAHRHRTASAADSQTLTLVTRNKESAPFLPCLTSSQIKPVRDKRPGAFRLHARRAPSFQR